MIILFNFIKELLSTNRTYAAVFCFLLGALGATANIVIMNEEIIIAICFVFFVVAVYVYGRSIVVESLTERSRQITHDFDSLFDLQLRNTELLISYFKKQSNLVSKINAIALFSKEEIKEVVSKKEKALNFLISSQIEQKLAIIMTKEISILMSLQAEIVKLFTAEIRRKFSDKSTEQQRLKTAVTKEIIVKLSMITS